MRPIRLSMQAFGPYAETQTLEMDRLGEKGIYAIIGETGAGKTTIFDAIVYALYGTGSGEDRADGQSLRAAAARPDLETKVELAFVCGGKTYNIIRKPTQVLTGKRSKDPVKYTGSVVLTMPDGSCHTSTAEIDGSKGRPGIIEQDILGVTKDQFCQTVMIAQGEFRKLLRAKTDERTEILRRIFRTQRFDALSRTMENLCRDKAKDLSESRRQVSFSLKAMRAAEGTPLSEELESLKAVKPEDLLLQDAVAMAARLAEADETDFDAAREVHRKAEEARDLAKQAFNRATELQDKRQRRSALAETLARQKKELESAEQRRAEAETRRPEIRALDDRISALKLKLPQYAELEKAKAEHRQTGEQFRQADAELTSSLRKEEALKKEQEDLNREAASLAGAADRRLAASQDLRDAKDRGDHLETLQKRVNARGAAQRALRQKQDLLETAKKKAETAAAALEALLRDREALGNTAQAVTRLEGEASRLKTEAEKIDELRNLLVKAQKAREAWNEAVKEFDRRRADADQLDAEARRLRHLYNASIAGLWARELQEGIPCPVCGSVHHPAPAELTAEAATAEEVEQAEAKAEAARQRFDEQARICAGKQADAEAICRQLADRLPEVPESGWPAEIEKRTRENQQALSQVSEDLTAARQADERYNALQASEPARRQEAETAANALHSAEAAVLTARQELETAEKEVTAAAGTLLPEGWTPLDLSDAIAECGASQQARQKALDQAEKDVRRLEAIGKRQTELTAEQTHAAEATRNAQSERSRLETQLENRKERCETILRELPWPTEKECLAVIGEKEKQRMELEAAIDASGKAVAQLNQSIAETTGQLKTLEADLAAAPEEDPEALKAVYLTRQAEYEAADREKNAVGSRRENNAGHRQTLDAQAESALALEREYRVMQDVSDTANGKVRGRDKVTLETWVQTAYFDRIIAYANRRLTHMSRQQYDLARQIVGEASKQSKTGLGLDVVDHANGQRRPIGTLSGGEGFLAALSFALGLSDAIQDSAASAVQLDAMFVDEGFGSLSENYLTLVMDELNDTANDGHRLIGIISHVDEVKEGIDRRIEVTKSASGISTAEIRCVL